jgi:succinyl-CoA synthetase beta subunit
MATVDALTHLGARPANFLDIPPVLEVSRVKQAFLLLLADDRIQSLFVNVFGAGIMRCDTIADGLLLAHLEKPISVPVIMRLAGTNAELAISRLERSGLPIQFVNDLASGAEKIASLQKEPPVSRPRTGWFGRLLGFRTRRHASGKS